MPPMNSFDLPEHLSERILPLGADTERANGEFVLYWAHHALRAEENPALETAAAVACSLGLPLLIYQGLGGRHRYNSDRSHRFILESARDFAGQLARVGQRLLFHLAADPMQPGPLRVLLERSAVAVSELFPVPPFPDWYRQHLQSRPDLCLLLVDCSCTLPMTIDSRLYTRAFQFRKAWMAELRQRAVLPWPTKQPWPPPFEGDPGFEPFDPGSKALDDAIANCRIDHSIPPVADNPGGSAAGYARWDRFCADSLADYHRLRNDAALSDAVSRLSPYLHFGCVSPFRIAREAASAGSEGAEKFIDELLTWRELNHHFCHRSDTLETLDAIPDWARESLQQHEADPRPALLDWETLARGRSGDPLWDLAQRSLLRRGELHNNVRMTWGKAFLPWTPRANRALKLLIDLNHRFALDGCDPNSYGGLLWCLGQFDRPFPPGPIFGKVRQRSARRHASRLDVDRYARQVSKPAGGTRLRVAVVGAGMAGLTAARILEDQGHEVLVVEKARGAGGRMSTRRVDGWQFDHGAQYFTARDARFMRHVVAWRERGLVREWPARIPQHDGETRYVAVPGMSAICSEMAAGLGDCRFEWPLRLAHFENDRWLLERQDGTTLEADAMIMTAPPPQAQVLIPEEAVVRALQAVEMLPGWAVMVGLDRPLASEWDARFVEQGPLGWLAGESSRPGRPDDPAWVLHATPAWSLEHLGLAEEDVCTRLLEAARQLPGVTDFRVEFAIAHRWRYARAECPLEQGALWFESRRLALAGDWCHGSRVEGAFLSGAAAAGRVMAAAYKAQRPG